MLGASLAVKIHHPLVRSLDDLLNSPYPVLVKNNTSVYRYFSGAAPGSVQHRLFAEKIARSNFDMREADGMRKIAEGDWFKIRKFGDAFEEQKHKMAKGQGRCANCQNRRSDS